MRSILGARSTGHSEFQRRLWSRMQESLVRPNKRRHSSASDQRGRSLSRLDQPLSTDSLSGQRRGRSNPPSLRGILRPKSPEDEVKGYREAVLQAPELAEVYKHYRGENIPDDTFFKNTLVDTFKIPESDVSDFKQIFLESLDKAKLLAKHGDKMRVLDVSEDAAPPEEKSERLKKLGAAVAVKASDTCFVMQPFAPPLGDYYEKIFKPAIEKAGLQPVRADAEIFGTGTIIDQVWRGSTVPRCWLRS